MEITLTSFSHRPLSGMTDGRARNAARNAAVDSQHTRRNYRRPDYRPACQPFYQPAWAYSLTKACFLAGDKALVNFAGKFFICLFVKAPNWDSVTDAAILGFVSTALSCLVVMAANVFGASWGTFVRVMPLFNAATVNPLI